jgi:hypothetical protein
MKKSLLFLGCLFFIGCVTAPTTEQLRNADYGTYPINYEDVVKNYMQRRLKDPSSATYRFTGSPKSMYAGGMLAGGIKYGYGICSYINARNSFGGYVGEKLTFFLIKNQEIVYMDDLELNTIKACQ